MAARRNDFKSIWEATKGPNGNGMYCLGYANPISQTYLDEGQVLYANDPSVWLTKEDHKELVRLTAEDGVDPMRTGRYAAGPLEQLDYFDPIYGYVLPFMHMMCYGVIKKFLKMLRNKVNNCPNTCYFSPMQLKQLQANGKGLTAPHDMHREYQDFVQYAGEHPDLTTDTDTHHLACALFSRNGRGRCANRIRPVRVQPCLCAPAGNGHTY